MEIYRQNGIDVLRQVERHFPKGAPKLSTAEVWNELDTFSSGWNSWPRRVETGDVKAFGLDPEPPVGLAETGHPKRNSGQRPDRAGTWLVAHGTCKRRSLSGRHTPLTVRCHPERHGDCPICSLKDKAYAGAGLHKVKEARAAVARRAASYVVATVSAKLFMRRMES
jgi:hypothetical protein